MGKLLRFTPRLIFLFIVIISAIDSWKDIQGEAMQLPFDNHDGVPLLLGVQPGVTSYKDALELLQSQRWTRLIAPNRTADVLAQGAMRVLLTPDGSDDLVAQIELLAAQHTDWGCFGQIVTLLGPPQSLVVQQQYTQSFWHSGQVEFIHEHRLRGFISLDDPLESMAVSAKPAPIPVSAVAWKGFSSVEAYLGSSTNPSLK